VNGGLALFAAPRARLAVAGVAALLAFARLGAMDLWPPDEPRYALIAEELRTWENGWRGAVLLHLHGEPYTQKPPLFYWLAALAGAPLGRVTETAARLPSALAGVACVAATMALGARLFGPIAGTLAGLLLATTFDWGYRARTVQLDTLLALFEVLALLAYVRVQQAANPGERRRSLGWMHASLGLAVLTKGPIGFAVPLLAIAGHLAWERRLRELGGLLPAWGLALSIGPGLAWIAAAVALGPPGFFDVAVVDNLFGRAVRGTAHAQPVWFYFEKFPPDLLPWLLLLPVAAVHARRGLDDSAKASPWRFVLAWIATSVVLFSLISGKRVRYLLPVEPAFALLFAATLARWLADATPRAGRRLVAIAGCVAVVQLVAYAWWLPSRNAVESPKPLALAAAAIARPGETIGAYRAADLANALAYYGEHPLDLFRTEDQLATFVAGGGRVLLFEAHRRAEIERVVAVDVRSEVSVAGEDWFVATIR
jgi:4-amino-4-deoxy-L-arabinose transferase-like glycosyltransferase